jgi:hypothetical protein
LLPALDFGPLILIVWTIIAVPALLGAIATILASSCGAQAVAHLPGARHFLATVIGGAVGCLCIVGVLWLGLLLLNSVASVVAGAIMLFGLIAVLLSAPLAGGLLGYQVGKFVSSQLNWYRCRTCGASFRSKHVRQQCLQCAEVADRIAVERACARGWTNIREL